jgi:hypothetical protein
MLLCLFVRVVSRKTSQKRTFHPSLSACSTLLQLSLACIKHLPPCLVAESSTRHVSQASLPPGSPSRTARASRFSTLKKHIHSRTFDASASLDSEKGTGIFRLSSTQHRQIYFFIDLNASNISPRHTRLFRHFFSPTRERILRNYS